MPRRTVLAAAILALLPRPPAHADLAFSPASTISGLNGPARVVADDFDDDGDTDLAVANCGSVCSGTGTGSVQILVGAGDGTFTLPPPITGPTNPARIGTGDFNRDGDVDLIVQANTGGNTTYLQGASGATFAATGQHRN